MKLSPKTLSRLTDDAIACMASRPADFVIPNATEIYLYRWWRIPRNPLFNAYIHHVVADDYDRALHDHPWPSWSVMVGGRMREITPLDQRQPCEYDFREGGTGLKSRIITAGDVVYRGPRLRHRLEVLPGETAITYFITGPRVHTWGFYTETGFVRWYDYIKDQKPGRNSPHSH